MSLNFETESRQGYLLMTYEGSYAHSLVEEFTDQILETCKSQQPTKLLIDLRLVTGNMSVIERYQLALTAARKYFIARLAAKIPGCRYAIVGTHPLVDSKKFEETVATNQGLNLRIFTDIQAAHRWLEVEAGNGPSS